MIEPPTDGTETVFTLRLSTLKGLANFVLIYAPTLQASSVVKDQFYEILDSVVNRIPASKHIYLLGDFNVRVGTNQESWPNVLGHHGIGHTHEWEWPETPRVLLLPQLMCDQHLLPEQDISRSILETSEIKSLASTGLGHRQTWLPIYKRRRQHQSLPQCRLWHQQLTDCFKGGVKTQETPPFQEEKLAKNWHRHQQDSLSSKIPGVHGTAWGDLDQRRNRVCRR